MQQGYTSPSAEASDTAVFYSAQSHDQELGDGQRPLETQRPRERTSPERPEPGASVSAEELQLAAQLTQGLAPMMAAHNQAQEQQLQQVQEAEMQPREDSYEDHTRDVSYQDHHTPQQDLHDQVQESEPQYDDQIRDPEYQDQARRDTASLHQQLQTQLADHERELQNILHQQAQAQTPVESPYAPPSITPTHQHHMPLSHLGQQYQMQDGGIPPRKRSKISRACDECRRKKIKCDAPSEASAEPCSNCRRSSSPCLFSRIPQKRGPSKG